MSTKDYVIQRQEAGLDTPEYQEEQDEQARYEEEWRKAIDNDKEFIKEQNRMLEEKGIKLF